MLALLELLWMLISGIDSRSRPGICAKPEVQSGPCLHRSRSPRWESVADMGKPAKITGYRCDEWGPRLPADDA